MFETQWRKNLFTAALKQVKEKFSLKQFQVFDLLVLNEWPAAKVARSLGMTLANVYVIRHRISAAIKKETKRLEHRLEQEAEMQPPRQTKEAKDGHFSRRELTNSAEPRTPKDSNQIVNSAIKPSGCRGAGVWEKFTMAGPGCTAAQGDGLPYAYRRGTEFGEIGRCLLFPKQHAGSKP